MPWTGTLLDDTIAPSAARTTSGQIVSSENYAEIDVGRVQIDVTAASGTTPTLNAFVETTIDGVNWDPIATFAQKTGVAREVVAIPSILGKQVRARWVIGGTTPSFTFSIRLIGEPA